MATCCTVKDCRCPCHTVTEDQRAGALVALRNAKVPLIQALAMLGYKLTPGLRDVLTVVQPPREGDGDV